MNKFKVEIEAQISDYYNKPTPSSVIYQQYFNNEYDAVTKFKQLMKQKSKVIGGGNFTEVALYEYNNNTWELTNTAVQEQVILNDITFNKFNQQLRQAENQFSEGYTPFGDE